MIAEMKKLFIFTTSKRKKELLSALRELGVLHIENENKKTSAEAEVCKRDIKKLTLCTQILKDAQEANKINTKSKDTTNQNPGNFCNIDSSQILSVCDRVLEIDEKKKEITETINSLKREYDNILIWGNYDSALMDKVKSKVKLRFAIISKKDLRAIENDCEYIVLRAINTSDILIAVLGDYMFSNNIKTLGRHEKSLTQLQDEINEKEKEFANLKKELLALASCFSACDNNIKTKSRELEFIGAFDSMQDVDSLSYITGYIPTEKCQQFVQFAKNDNYFGYLMRDINETDNPPTLLKNTKYTSMLSPVIALLGLFPGYKERDISFFFLSFFAVFFALIIGDAAYGLIFLITGVVIRLKQKKRTNLNSLLIFLGGATVIWGAITGTWFASKEILNAFPFLKIPVIPSLSNFPSLFSVSPAVAQNSMMRLCFSLGAFQLLTACVMNVCSKVKDKNLSLFADIGWFCIISTLYFLVLYLLIAGPLESALILKHTNIVLALIAIGFILIVVFAGQKPGLRFSDGLKSGLKDLFTTFLNIVSSFGNIMSYIRLFAVGMASVAIAESFNLIASPMLSTPFVIVGIIVLVIGHTLNLVMGLLSVVVHGVRLNVMEFSNQLGLEWSGYEYKPFK